MSPANESDLKDSRLARLARDHNVAAFASFSDRLEARHIVLPRDLEGTPADDVAGIVGALFRCARDGSVNVRTFDRERQKGMPFYYGLRSLDDVLGALNRSAQDGLFTIVNETIDVSDGGVSGVSLGGIAEIAPDSTPRAVESEGTASLDLRRCNRVLSTVYRVPIEVPGRTAVRYEFSIHPNRVGFRKEHQLVWESEDVPATDITPAYTWPNKFSRMLGDKAYGLLLAHSAGARVPTTSVISRRVAPFSFGDDTGSGEWWLRTCPAEQRPGHFSTFPRWVDPYALLAAEDPAGEISSVLAQEYVRSDYSGAAGLSVEQAVLVEGVAGTGDRFMLGAALPTQLPTAVNEAVGSTVRQLSAIFGPCRIEWAYAEGDVWVLQLHRMRGSFLAAGVLNPGVAKDWIAFDPRDGLEVLENLIERARTQSGGIEVVRPIGVTSHVGDILRRSGVPGRLAADSDLAGAVDGASAPPAGG